MRSLARPLAAFAATLALVGPLANARAQDADEPVATATKAASRADIYDPKADATAAVSEAAAKAGRDHKRVLLMFGGNWCGWCHKLHDLFESDREIAQVLSDEYLLVMVDTEAPGGEQLLEQCKWRLSDEEAAKGVGFPFLTILDDEGEILVAQRTDPLEVGDHHDPAKVLAFLTEHKAEPADACEVLRSAIERASAEDKRVFLQFGAPWCGWCHRLEDFLARPEIAEIMAEDYVIVKVDTDRMTGGQKLLAEQNPKPGGIPWVVILDAAGEPIINSNGPNGNIGYPVQPAEIDHFVAMLKKASRRIDADEIAQIEAALKAAADAGE